MVFVSSFHPRGGVFCCSWRDGAFFFFFPRRDGAVVFSEAGRGGFFFFFDGDGAVFFFFRGPGRDGCFWRWHFFWWDGAKSLHRPAKGDLNRPASRPCKALKKITLQGDQSRSWSAEQGKENKKKRMAAYPPLHPPHCSFGENLKT